MTVLDWMLDSDPSIRWQTLRDLVDAPAEVVAAERARVATEGWGRPSSGLAGQKTASGREARCSPPRRAHSEQYGGQYGQPWNATAYSLLLLRDLGVDPHRSQVRQAVARVRDHCRWEHAGQPFFSGEVEPCINGMVIVLGVYFDQNVDDGLL